MKRLILLAALFVVGCGGKEWRNKWVQENGDEVKVIEPIGFTGGHAIYSAESTKTGKMVSISHNNKTPLARNKVYKLDPNECWDVLTTTIHAKVE